MLAARLCRVCTADTEDVCPVLYLSEWFPLTPLSWISSWSLFGDMMKCSHLNAFCFDETVMFLYVSCFILSASVNIPFFIASSLALAARPGAEPFANAAWLVTPAELDATTNRLMPMNIHVDSSNLHFIYVCTKGS